MHESGKWKWSRSVVSNSSPPRGLQPTRLIHPWDFPGKSTGVGCHRLLTLIKRLFSFLLSAIRRVSYAYLIFWLGCYFSYWAAWVVCIFWRLSLCRLHWLQIFSPILWIVFHFVYGFLWCGKVFKFNWAPLVYFNFHYSRRWIRKDTAVIYVKEYSVYVFYLFL